MESRIMNVFYGNDLLPYKDSERVVHYPVVGNSFEGANNTTKIRFYVDRIGGTENVSWVIVSKLPNGKLGYEILSVTNTDSELGEKYLEFSMSSYYTQMKGDIFLALRGYQGEVSFIEGDNGLYEISGNPLIEVTGGIKLSINYAPLLQGNQFLPTDTDKIIAALSNYLKVKDGIVVVNDVDSEELSGYYIGQLFFNTYDKLLWIKEDEDEIVRFNDYNVKSIDKDNYSNLNQVRNSLGGNNNIFCVEINNALCLCYFFKDDNKWYLHVANTYGEFISNEIAGGDDFNDLTFETIYSNYPSVQLNGDSGSLTDEQQTIVAQTNSYIINSGVYYKKVEDYKFRTIPTLTTSSSSYTIEYYEIAINGTSWTKSTKNVISYSKAQVDQKFADLGTVLSYEGTKTVAQINALNTSTLRKGYFYVVSDSGTITLGNLNVQPNDSVVWNGSGFDKLPPYDFSNFVTLDSDQEISGDKTFLSGIRVGKDDFDHNQVKIEIYNAGYYQYEYFMGGTDGGDYAYTTFSSDLGILGDLYVEDNLLPAYDSTGSDIGEQYNPWRDLYLSRNLNFAADDEEDIYATITYNITYDDIRFLLHGNVLCDITTTAFAPWNNNAYDLGSSSYKWKNLYLAGSLNGATYSLTIDGIYNRLNNHYVNGTTIMDYNEFGVFTRSANTTFTLISAPANHYPEYKALITNSGNSMITLTFNGVSNILTNNDSLTVVNGTNSTITLTSGTTLECSVVNGKMVAIDFSYE